MSLNARLIHVEYNRNKVPKSRGIPHAETNHQVSTSNYYPENQPYPARVHGPRGGINPTAEEICPETNPSAPPNDESELKENLSAIDKQNALNQFLRTHEVSFFPYVQCECAIVLLQKFGVCCYVDSILHQQATRQA